MRIIVVSLPFCLVRTKTVVRPSLAFFSLRDVCTMAHCLSAGVCASAAFLPAASHWIFQSPCVEMTSGAGPCCPCARGPAPGRGACGLRGPKLFCCGAWSCCCCCWAKAGPAASRAASVRAAKRSDGLEKIGTGAVLVLSRFAGRLIALSSSLDNHESTAGACLFVKIEAEFRLGHRLGLQ